MLDKFLEVVCEKTKQAEAQAKTEALLGQLPDGILKKLAYGGGLASCGSGDTGCWLDKFRGTPLLDRAIAIEKEDLDIQMQENERRRAEQAARQQFGDCDATWAARDDLNIKRKLLELELAGAGSPEMGGQEGEDLDVAMAPEPEAVTPPAAEAAPAEPKVPTEKVTKETTEKPTPEKLDIKTAAAGMRMRLALLKKEAQPAEGASSFRR